MSVGVGKQIKGYELGECLGTGAFGAVYRAYQPQLERHVAVKIILGEHANRPDFIRRFEFEAQIIAQLEHLHIVPLYDYWREPGGAYLVMRLMKGGSLADAVEPGPLPPLHALQVMRQICAGLAAAHRQGIVHRDLKPANILLDEEGNAYLSDFGIAKELEKEAGITQTGAIMGTPAYITPEQAQSGTITAQTDIYSLGVVLYEMLVGGHPFPDTPTGGLIVKHIQEPLPSVRDSGIDLPTGLDEVIQKATAKEPSARYETVLAMLADLSRVLAGEQVLTPELTQAELDAPNPYKGLRAFQEADAADFFGREALTGQLLARLLEPGEACRFLALVGPSGSGKSSVVKAGLLPALRKGALPGSEDWFFVEMVPGMHPFEELARGLERIATVQRTGLLSELQRDEHGLRTAARLVLPDDQAQLLLVIDQFEELFTLGEDPEQTAFFLESLYAAVTDPNSPVRILVTLRADFYDRPLRHERFSRLIKERTEIVVPLTSGELAAAIRGPAERVSAAFEGGLVTDIVADVREQPGALPLLQYALTELYERREGSLLTRMAYQAIGGVLGALGKRAEEVYAGLGEKDWEVTRQLFLRLVTLGEGVEDTRRRVLQTELASLEQDVPGSQERLERVSAAFGRYRLLTFDRDPATRGPTVEVAHEALLREWPRLREWLDDSRADLRMQRVLGNAGKDWAAAGQDPSFLLRGSRLDQFSSWSETSSLALTMEETAFLEASLAAKRGRDAEEADRQAREQDLEQRSRRVLRWLVVVMTVAAIAGIVLSAFAFDQRRQAQTSADQANRSAATATVAQGQAEIDAGTALAAQEGAQNQADIAATNEAKAETQRVLAEREAQIALARELAAAAIVNSQLEVDPELGLQLAVQSAQITLEQDGFITVEAEDALHRALRWALPLQILVKNTIPSGGLALSPNGVYLATGGAILGAGVEGRNWIYIWDTITLPDWELVQTLEGHDATVRALTYSRDGVYLATGSQLGGIKIWDANKGEELFTLSGHRGNISELDFNPEGTLLASASLDGTVRIWDVTDGRELFLLDSHQREVTSVRFSPNGELLASASWNRDIKIWDVSTGLELRTLRGHSFLVNALVFTPGGDFLVSGSSDGVVKVWAVESWNEIRTICCHIQDRSGGIEALAISPDGELLVTGGPRNATMKFWDIDGMELFTLLQSGGGATSIIIISRDGSKMFTQVNRATRPEGFDTGSFSAWDVSPGRELTPLTRFNSAVYAVAYNPAGTHLATADSGGEIRVWELLTDHTQASPLFTLPEDAHNGAIQDLAFSPDGTTLATAGSDRRVKLWELGTTGVEEVQTLSGHTGEVLAITFSPDGATLASASVDDTANLWNLLNPAEHTVLRGHTDDVLAVTFNLDGSQLATVSADGTARIWDPGSGRTTLTLRGHEGAVHSVAFSPDGALLLTAGADGTARVWNVDTAEAVMVLAAHETGVKRAAFTPDGQRIITSGANGVSKVWEAATARELFVLSGHDDAILDLDLLADGSRMVTASADGTVNFYILDSMDLYAYAQTRVTRTLTEEECQRYLHVETCPVMPGSE